MKKTKTKPFRVAVSGKTVDGREIPAQDIIDMAETYNPELYQARINLEHLLSIFPDSTFKAYGDVLSVEAKEEELNGESVTSLYATLEVTEDLAVINKNHQKIFTSIEYRPNFRESGKAYLTGLAVTDTPASVGTEALKFVVANEATVNYSASIEGEKLTAEAPEQAEEPEKKPFFSLKNLFTKETPEQKDDFHGFKELEEATRQGFSDVEHTFSELKATVEHLSKQAKEAAKQIESQRAAIEALQALAKTPEDQPQIPDHNFSGDHNSTPYELPEH